MLQLTIIILNNLNKNVFIKMRGNSGLFGGSMKIAVCIAALAALVGSCYRANVPVHLGSASDNVLDYQIQGDRYAVLVVREGGMSEQQARTLARQRAAEIAVEQGDRYFIIEGETQVQMVQTGGDYPNQNAFYGNMYHELIVEKDFSKQQTTAQQEGGTRIVPALRVVFVIYPIKENGSALDACKYTNCPN